MLEYCTRCNQTINIYVYPDHMENCEADYSVSIEDLINETYEDIEDYL